MPRSKASIGKESFDEIPVSAFKGIQIHFPEDVYRLAVWLAMSDQAKSTAVRKPQTMLHGLAGKFALLYGPDYSNPISADDVMAIFRRNGIKGNPGLRLEDDVSDQPLKSKRQ